MPRRNTKDPALFGGDPVPFDAISSGGDIVVGGLTVGVDL
jgi:hypothetical protein